MPGNTGDPTLHKRLIHSLFDNLLIQTNDILHPEVSINQSW